MDDALRVASCLDQVEAFVKQSVDKWVPYAMLRDDDLGTITSLAEVGVLALRDPEFLDLEVAIIRDNVKSISVQTNGQPKQILHIDEYDGRSKLDLVIALLRSGWSPTPGTPRTYKKYSGRRTCPKNFVLGIRKPSSHFMRLLEADQLFARGVVQIVHDGKDLHYQALLRLHGEELTN
eukprot:3082837-Pyramimonas_sp.AAC.1